MYNVHSLLHIANDARIHGPLDNFSGFPFENYLQRVKKLVRSGNKPLEQLLRRLAEAEACGRTRSSKVSPVRNEITLVRSSQCCVDPFASNHGGLYKKAVFRGSTLSVTSPNNYVLLSGSRVCRITSSLSRGSHVSITGYVYSNLGNLYEYPCASSLLKIFLSPQANCEHLELPSSVILCKCMAFPCDEEIAFFPLLHSL